LEQALSIDMNVLWGNPYHKIIAAKRHKPQLFQALKQKKLSLVFETAFFIMKEKNQLKHSSLS
jgi:hypothetical protein